MNLSNFKLIIQHGPTNEEQYKLWMLSNTYYRWMDNDKCVATVTIEKWSNGWIDCHDLKVSEPYRKNGLGNQLVQFIIEKGVNHLSVDPNNSIAIYLYKKYGFYFSGGYEDKLVRMERH